MAPIGRFRRYLYNCRMNLDGTKFLKVTPLLISVEGQWSHGRVRDWCGWANATEPFVAMTFLSTPTACNWSKSERGGTPRKIRILLGHYDEQGRDVQVNFSVAGGYQLGRSRVHSPSYRPDVLSNREFPCGVIQKFAQVEGEPCIELLVLFLARRDVRSARCGLWRLRQELAESIADDPLRQMMTCGRTGQLLVGSSKSRLALQGR
jgi:hypothetical protein